MLLHNFIKEIINDTEMEALIIDKEKVKEMLNDFPDNIVLEELIDRMIITAKIEKALDQLNKGEFMTSLELDDEIRKWEFE